MTRMRARTVSTTAITRQPAAFGGGGTADRAVADKANETKSKNADDVSDWLYQQCNKAKVKMMTDQTPLMISLTVLQALCKIEDDILESMNVSDKMNSEFEYANYSLVH
jgi:hypothetical protein